jgi:hypothetical protein
MSRRTVASSMVGLILLTGMAAPALADPIAEDDRASVCLRMDPEGGREGVCVWLPIKP